MWKGGSPYGNNHGVAEPSGFRREMTVFAPKFGGFDQHDSQEFLLYAMDGLHTELNRIVKKPKKENCQFRLAASWEELIKCIFVKTERRSSFLFCQSCCFAG